MAGAVAALAGIGFFGAGGIVRTDPPPAELHACVNKYTGTMRSVSSPGACTLIENQISWNQAGTPGPQGDPGPPGQDGATGLDVIQVDGNTHNFTANILTWLLKQSIDCPPDNRVIGGGFVMTSGDDI